MVRVLLHVLEDPFFQEVPEVLVVQKFLEVQEVQGVRKALEFLQILDVWSSQLDH